MNPLSKYRHLIALLSLILALPAMAQEDEDEPLAKWTSFAPINVDRAEPGLVRVRLTPPVVDATQRGLDDLRVVDEEDQWVPYAIQEERIVEETAWRNVRMINRVFEPGQYSRVTLDFLGQVEKNQLRVTLSGENYRRYALLEGSVDGVNWSVIDTAWLFHYEDQGEVYDLTTFRFPVNDFRYLRLTVQNMEDETGRVAIESVEMRHVIERQRPDPIPVNVSAAFVEPEDDDDTATIVEIDCTYRNLPIRSIQIDPEDAYFYRRYTLSGRNAETEILERRAETGWEEIERDVPWKVLERGVLYRIVRQEETLEQIEITPDGTGYRYLRLRIENADNPPLDVEPADIDVTRWPLSSIVFDYDPAHTYRLVAGNRGARAPDYDLRESLGDRLRDEGLPEGTLGGLQPLPSAARVPDWPERYAWVTWVALTLAVAAMVYLIARNIKHLRAED